MTTEIKKYVRIFHDFKKINMQNTKGKEKIKQWPAVQDLTEMLNINCDPFILNAFPIC